MTAAAPVDPEAAEQHLTLSVPGPVEDGAAVPPTDPKWWGAHFREFRWQAELARLMADPVWYGAGVPRGDGSPVLLIPGFMAGDQSLSVMATWLRRIGYRPRRAGMALNVRCSDTAMNRLEVVLHHASMRAGGQKVALVGHSRGGHFAKALASRHPDLVSQVISLGTGLDDPFRISEVTRYAVAGVRRVLTLDAERKKHGCFTATCQCPYSRDFQREFPASVPITSIYSKGDGVVWWEACVVPYARCVEVRGSHIGLAFNRHAYREIGRTLAGSSS